MIFNETLFENNQPHSELISVRQAGRLNRDVNYAIERSGSPTNVLGCVLSGSLYIKFGERLWALHSENSFVLPHDTCYRMYSDMKAPAEMLWLNLRGELISDIIDRLFDGGEAVARCALEDKINAVAKLIGDKADRAADIFEVIFSALMQIYSHRYEAPDAAVPPARLGEQFDEYICKNVQNPFSVSAMAEYFNMSTDALGRTFRSELGMTPYRYYQSIRLDIARSMLANTSLTLEDIASRLNYTDRNYFTLCFRRATGISPVKYRLLHKTERSFTI